MLDGFTIKWKQLIHQICPQIYLLALLLVLWVVCTQLQIVNLWYQEYPMAWGRSYLFLLLTTFRHLFTDIVRFHSLFIFIFCWKTIVMKQSVVAVLYCLAVFSECIILVVNHFEVRKSLFLVLTLNAQRYQIHFLILFEFCSSISIVCIVNLQRRVT